MSGPSAATPSPFSPELRALSFGVLLSVTIVAFQSMGVVTILPRVAEELDGRSLYGWGISAFMLASIVGTVVAGQTADQRGPRLPFAVAVALFAAGSIVAAVAPTWMVLLVGRALQGTGTGAIMALTYVTISRAYPPAMHPRMMALLSTAWVVPSLVGPAAGGLIADHVTWRLVFVLLLPVLLGAAMVVLPGLGRLPAPGPPAANTTRRWIPAVGLVLGTGLLLAALDQTDRPLVLVGLAATGGILAFPALSRLLPAGTLRVRRGLPAGIAVRGLLTAAFLGTESFVPYGLKEIHGLSAAEAGIALTAGSLTWTAGALLQARLDRRDGGSGRVNRVTAGFVVLAIGVATTAIGVLTASAPIVVAIAGWTAAGLGIGIAYPTGAVVVLSAVRPGDEGSVSSSLTLAETLAVGVTAGVGGAAVGFGLDHGWSDAGAIGVTFAVATAAAIVGIAVSRRLLPTATPAAG